MRKILVLGLLMAAQASARDLGDLCHDSVDHLRIHDAAQIYPEESVMDVAVDESGVRRHGHRLDRVFYSTSIPEAGMPVDLYTAYGERDFPSRRTAHFERKLRKEYGTPMVDRPEVKLWVVGSVFEPSEMVYLQDSTYGIGVMCR